MYTVCSCRKQWRCRQQSGIKISLTKACHIKPSLRFFCRTSSCRISPPQHCNNTKCVKQRVPRYLPYLTCWGGNEAAAALSGRPPELRLHEPRAFFTMEHNNTAEHTYHQADKRIVQQLQILLYISTAAGITASARAGCRGT